MQLTLGGLDMQGSIPTVSHRNPASLAAGDRIGLVPELGPGRWLIPGFNPRRNACFILLPHLRFADPMPERSLTPMVSCQRGSPFSEDLGRFT